LKLDCFFKIFPAVMVAVWIALSPLAVASAATAPGTIRVALVREADSLEFKVTGNYQLVDQSTGKEIAKLERGDNWLVKLQGNKIELRVRQDTYGPFKGPVLVRELSFSATITGASGSGTERHSIDGLMAIGATGKVVSLSPSGNPSVVTATGTSALSGDGGGTNLVSLTGDAETRRYRGNMEFRVEDGKLAAVNELNIEDYLRGVVPAEIPASWPAEALKAQAVAARNYALQRAEVTRGRSYNVTSDQYSQVYKGYDAESPATNRAVEETRGVVMLDRGNLVTAFFHASSGGYTENSEDVWKYPLPYIKSKTDPFDKNDRHYNWQVDYTAEQLAQQLQKAGYNFKEVNDIEELARTASGKRVEKIAVEGEDPDGKPLRVEIFNADSVRLALGLKSALFTMQKDYDKDKNLTGVSISGSGWGHGLGMSQWGALGMAEQGYSYQDILKYYYIGITLAGDYGRPAVPVRSSGGNAQAWLGN